MEIEPKIMSQVKSILGEFENKYLTSKGSLKRNNVINDLDKFDHVLMTKLFKDPLIHKNYVEKIADAEVFKLNQFVEMFEYKEFWENSYTKYTNKIGLTANGKFIDESADVVLDFPFKDTVLKAGMTKEDLDKDESADEPFLNEIIAKPEIDELLEPKIFVNAKKYDQNGEHNASSYSDQDNLIIKGNNLIALYSLKKKYSNKINMIYIDPPYNTGSDSFAYNDKFNESTWLTFMKNRLEVSKELLTDDGVIFVSIDRNEFAELKVLMDEVFENSYLGTMINVSTPNGRDYGSFAQTHDYIHVYAKNIDMVKTNTLDVSEDKFKLQDEISKFYLHPLFNSNSAFSKDNRPNLYYPFYISEREDEKGYRSVSVKKDTLHTIEVFPPKSKTDDTQFVWRWGRNKGQELGETELVGQQKSDGSFRIAQKMRPKKQIPRTILQDAKYSNRRGTEELQKLFDGKVFSFPKPENLLKTIIEIGSNTGDTVLDFHMGSATTQAVAMKMHRHFIGIEQMDYINTVSVPRLQKVIAGEQGGISKDVGWHGGGSFVYAELMEKNQGYLKDLLAAKDINELDAVYKRMKVGADFDFRVDLDKYENDAERKALSFEEQKQLLVKLLDKNQLYYNFNNIDDADVRDLISDKDYQFNQSFYGKRD
ncbi:DNA methyltransferase [Lactiplantibacillus pentosus]|uniref:DNA methyltransferase n=1 Tax=Lactiplantibacillus pentosus TaxID=1589 RepID=UPI003C2695B3